MKNPADGAAPFEAEPLDTDTFCLYRAHIGAPDISLPACPVRLGKVLRVATEVEAPFAVVEQYWPLLRPSKYPDKVNLFGTWTKGVDPQIEGERPKKKSRTGALPALMVELRDVLVWPVDVEESGREDVEGVRIPLLAFERLRRHGVDLAGPEFTFAKRGKAFYMGICKGIAEQLYSMRPSEKNAEQLGLGFEASEADDQ